MVILALVVVAPSLSLAVDIENDLQNDLIQSKTLILGIKNKLDQGLSVETDLARLRTTADNIKVTQMLLEERFRQREEKARTIGSTAVSRHQAMAEGFREALSEYLNLINNLPSDGTMPQSAVRNVKSFLDKLLPKKKRPLIGSLPYKHLNYPGNEPNSAPAITPAFKGGNKIVSPEDTKSTPEAPISHDISVLAQSLKWNPVLIYEYVKNNVETEWYWGCMKGAEETLRQKSGNDCDQAALFTALLRASGFPTRYVRGTIEFFAGGRNPVPMDKIKNLTGVDDPVKIAEFFQKAGIPYKPIITGGVISNFQIEHLGLKARSRMPITAAW